MKKIAAYLISPVLFALGHMTSRCLLRYACLAWTYPAYNNLMHWSVTIEQWAKVEIMWRDPQNPS